MKEGKSPNPIISPAQSSNIWV